MTFPTTNVDADPDPTSQITWPGRQQDRGRRGSNTHASILREERSGSRPSVNRLNGNGKQKPARSAVAEEAADSGSSGKKRMSTLDLVYLSVSMGGSQVAWTVELGYGTPFLLELGLTEQLTSLVWLAGPISGLIAQPVIGAISDASTSKYRRRFWIVLSTFALVISTLTLAYCREIATFFVDLLGSSAGSWDPKYIKAVQDTAIGFAIVSFYVLDFALNALQASLRNLLLDVTPPGQLNAANAWHSRMLNAGNIVGYGFGFLPLANMPILRLLGGSQFRKFCVVCMIILAITVWITCWTQEEQPREQLRLEKGGNSMRDILKNIWTTIVTLPRPIRRVCYVQLFAFMGWFPFLFYSTTYIGQVMAYEMGKEPDHDYATRTGALAMLIYSLVAVAAGTLLPHLTRRDAALLAHEGDEDEDVELSRLRAQVREWRAEAARRGKPLRLPLMPFFLRNIWTGALLLFTFLTLATFFVTKVWQAIILVSLVGICWAVACWAPFAIIMEFLKEHERDTNEDGEAIAREWARRPSHSRTLSTPAMRRNSRVGDAERTPLLRRRSFDQHNPDAASGQESVAGGTILGIHNLAIVMPQFVVAIASSVIFGIVDADVDSDPANDAALYGKNGVAWVLRFGGVCTLFGAVLARRVPPTRTEKEIRRRLAELRVLNEEGMP